MKTLQTLSMAALGLALIGCGADEGDDVFVVTHSDQPQASANTAQASPTFKAVSSSEREDIRIAQTHPALQVADHISQNLAFVPTDLGGTGFDAKQCADPALFACRVDSMDLSGGMLLSCLDIDGRVLFSASRATLLNAGCEAAMLDDLVQAYAEETCVTEIHVSDLPSGPIVDAFLREDAVEEWVCSNVDGSAYQWRIDDWTFRYTVDGAAADKPTDQCTWSLEMKADVHYTLDTRWFPQLLCQDYSKKDGGWTLDLSSANGATHIAVSHNPEDGSGQLDLDAFLDELSNEDPVCLQL